MKLSNNSSLPQQLKVCVLQPDYSTTDVDYQYYDPPRNIDHLLPGAVIDYISLNKLTTYRQLKALQHKGYDIFVNLCEGYLEWEVPSIDVIYTLELLGLPYTGPNTLLYDPEKSLMKYVAYCEGVQTPAYLVIHAAEEIEQQIHKLEFPVFVKPAKAGDSLGIDAQSCCRNITDLNEKVSALLKDYPELIVESYIAGRELTVLVAANPDGKSVRTFKPIEYIFPEGYAFKTYELKTSALHPGANIPCQDEALEIQLRNAASRIFKAFNGVGYGRLDFRVDENNTLYFLEINFTCSVFYTAGFEGSADYILQFDGIGQAGFLQHIIEEGIARHQRKAKKYSIKGDSISGYGIYANKDLAAGEIIFNGEGKSQRLITERFVEKNWNEEEKETFSRYAYPVAEEVFLLWDEKPEEWAPQNHSCDANTRYEGLNVITSKPVKRGEELTLDYASFLDNRMQPFHCKCGSANCRKWIQGSAGNNINSREQSGR